MKQVILLDLHDVARLKRGQPLVIQLGTGQAIEIGYDGKRAADLPGDTPSTPPAAPAPPKPPKPAG